MLRGLFITGTDTGVGKTVVAAALLHRFRSRFPARYWKPVQTGTGRDDDTATVRVLAECRDEEILDAGVRLPEPLSPHLAARVAGQQIEMDRVVHLLPADAEQTRWIVEGAGGALVPLNERELMADLMARLALPAVVVARSTLGTINHTLLTLEALRRRSLRVAGVVMVGPPNAENAAAIEQFGNTPVVAQMPCFPAVSSEALAHWARAELDPAGILEGFLQ